MMTSTWRLVLIGVTLVTVPSRSSAEETGFLNRSGTIGLAPYVPLVAVGAAP